MDAPRGSFPVKVSVRRLPPHMSAEQFWELCGRCPQPKQLLYFVAGRVKGRKTTWARAYLSFPAPREAEAFHAAFMQGWPQWMEIAPAAPSTQSAAKPVGTPELSASGPPKKEQRDKMMVGVEPSPSQRMPRGDRPDPVESCGVVVGGWCVCVCVRVVFCALLCVACSTGFARLSCRMSSWWLSH